ncbi:carbamoyltransferase HypF [Rhodoferax fermentans]|uniref:Hydrogenase maturation protein HypF n=1 Tax=Rhodoferax fermentans TaxID=28066 RepID=A0A1T1AV78_RHOFE|nr:carbamoyltransferase HypF [Rhodoferax fermentans]MBK1682023.1 hydrogenase maturation protein HypF [Rhodoferax fermentans]OOV08012.1 hydrogenase maturation protein HypF [Rhodoferax fermentans]
MARVLACGAFLKNAACLLDTAAAPAAELWSANHGDLSDPQACLGLDASVQHLLTQATGPIDAVAHDLHPDFFSTQLALRLAHELGVSAVAVQHHHAHIAAVLAEHGVDHPVIGIALDGVGLGTDHTAWGGEVLLVEGARCERLGHLSPLALPGGDKAAQEPWRMAAALLHHGGMAEHIVPRLSPAVGDAAAHTIHTMLQRGLNCPQSTAAGRWFDAVAGLLGLSVRQEFEAQAAIALEQAATRHLQKFGAAPINPALWNITSDGVIDLRPLLLKRLLNVDTSNPDAVDDAALCFHHTLAAALCQHTVALAHIHQITHVALGGGCFFNRILKNAIVAQLKSAGLNVLQTRNLSCGDAGLALGQAWVAARSIWSIAPRLCE